MLHESGAPNIPLWIVTRIEDEAVEHHRSIGCFVPAEDAWPLTVDIVQRDDLSPDGDPDATRHNPAQVRMTGTRLTPDEARELARMLNTAATLILKAAAGDQPRRYWGWNGGYGLAPVKPQTGSPAEQRSA